MSYDLMVFDCDAAPRDRSAFLNWYENLTQWAEGLDYNDPNTCTQALRAWFDEMIITFPPMNGPLASEDYDDSRVSDYCIANEAIYVAFAWSVADEAYSKMRQLAAKHEVGFFDVSSNNGEIFFPAG